MAGRKSTKTAAKAVETAEVKSAEPKAEEIKAEEKAAMTKAVSAKQAAEPKAAEPKTASAKKTAESKAAPKKAEGTTKAGKKEDPKHNLFVQYAGKSYGQEELVKKAKDAWKKEDSKRKVGDLKSVDLYVKPEENKVYYVINGSDKGSFDI